MKKLSWHQRWYKSIHTWLFTKEVSLPADRCTYIGAWAFIVFLPIFMLSVIGTIIGILVWSFHQAFIVGDPAALVIFSVIAGLSSIGIGVIVIQSQWFKRLKQKFCKPINWDL